MYRRYLYYYTFYQRTAVKVHTIWSLYCYKNHSSSLQLQYTAVAVLVVLSFSLQLSVTVGYAPSVLDTPPAPLPSCIRHGWQDRAIWYTDFGDNME